MSTRRIGRILPPNASPFELDVLHAGNIFPKLDLSLPDIYLSKLVTLPDSYLPWLVEEYGLEPFVRFFNGDVRRAIREGVPFMRKIGTLWAVRTGLMWVGHSLATVEEEPLGPHWYEFQLGLENPPDRLADLENVVEVSSIAKSYTRRLARIYSGYDVRPLMLDGSMLDEEGLLSDYSGVRVRPDWPILSFGRRSDYRAEIGAGRPLQLWQIQQFHSDLAYYTDRFLLDHGRLDEDSTILNNEFDIGIIQSYKFEADFPVSPAPSVYNFCKAMVILSEQHKFGDLNHTFAKRQLIEEGDNLRLSEDRIDQAGVSSRWEPILELTENVIEERLYTFLTMRSDFKAENTLGWVASRHLGTKLDDEQIDGGEVIAGRTFHRIEHQDFTLSYAGVETWPNAIWPLDDRIWSSSDVIAHAQFTSSSPAPEDGRYDEDFFDGGDIV